MRAVPVKIFRIVATRADGVVIANSSRGCEREDAGDVVGKVGVHVGVVDPVVKAGVGHRDDDATAVKARPTAVDVGHGGAVSQIVNVHDFVGFTVGNREVWTRFDPFHGILVGKP